MIFYGSKKIASHQRLYSNNKWSLDPEHYLELIQQRPQAFDSARPIRQWRKSWPICLERLLERFCQKQGSTKGIKEFITEDCQIDELRHIAMKEGMRALRLSGAQKVAAGETTISEVMRVAPQSQN